MFDLNGMLQHPDTALQNSLTTIVITEVTIVKFAWDQSPWSLYIMLVFNFKSYIPI